MPDRTHTGKKFNICLNTDRQQDNQAATKMGTSGNHFLEFHKVKKQGIGNMPVKIPQYDHLLLKRVISSSPQPPPKKAKKKTARLQ